MLQGMEAAAYAVGDPGRFLSKEVMRMKETFMSVNAKVADVNCWIGASLEMMGLLKKIACVETESWEAGALGDAVSAALDEPLQLLKQSKENLEKIKSELSGTLTDGTKAKLEVSDE